MFKSTLTLLIICALSLTACRSDSSSNNEQTDMQGNNTNFKKGMQKITFPSKDGLIITANLFHEGANLVPIILCHQANSSKEEYTEAAKKLNELGFNVLAVDLRSGGSLIEGGKNETAELAKQQGKMQNYINAMPDIEAAIDYMYNNYKKPVVLVGSSYSASLALKIAGENQKVRAVAAFSPGEYFVGTESETFIQDAMQDIHKPIFITSARKEVGQAKLFFDLATSGIKDLYVPEEEGIHGARALWSTTPGSAGYWSAFTDFLNKVKK